MDAMAGNAEPVSKRGEKVRDFVNKHEKELKKMWETISNQYAQNIVHMYEVGEDFRDFINTCTVGDRIQWTGFDGVTYHGVIIGFAYDSDMKYGLTVQMTYTQTNITTDNASAISTMRKVIVSYLRASDANTILDVSSTDKANIYDVILHQRGTEDVIVKYINTQATNIKALKNKIREQLPDEYKYLADQLKPID